MSELELYRYIHENDIEYHIHREGYGEVDNMEDFTDENYNQWKAYIFPSLYQLEYFVKLNSDNIFDDEGMHIILKKGYVVIDLFYIMEYYDIEPKNILY